MVQIVQLQLVDLIAKVKDLSFDTVARATTENARSLFGVPTD